MSQISSFLKTSLAKHLFANHESHGAVDELNWSGVREFLAEISLR